MINFNGLFLVLSVADSYDNVLSDGTRLGILSTAPQEFSQNNNIHTSSKSALHIFIRKVRLDPTALQILVKLTS